MRGCKQDELTPAHLSAARSIADESMVLLNNNNHALPLSTSTSKIAVVGPLADDALDQLGPDVPIGYDTTSADLKTTDKIVTVADGIKKADPGASVTTVPGVRHVHRHRPVQRDRRVRRGGVGGAGRRRDCGRGR